MVLSKRTRTQALENDRHMTAREKHVTNNLYICHNDSHLSLMLKTYYLLAFSVINIQQSVF